MHSPIGTKGVSLDFIISFSLAVGMCTSSQSAVLGFGELLEVMSFFELLKLTIDSESTVVVLLNKTDPFIQIQG